VYSVQQLSNLIGKPRAISTVYLSRLVKKKLATRVMKGMVSFVDDPFVIATQLVEPSYVSLDSALLFHGLIQQVPKEIECVTSKNSLRYEDIGAVYHKIAEGLFFGYKRHNKANSYVFVAEPEKAIIDGIYLNLYGRGDLDELMPKVNHLKLLELANRFDGRGSRKIRAVIK
jgi:predicted transcriptional regulator of viral defense system